jgi:hypothetical protein
LIRTGCLLALLGAGPVLAQQGAGPESGGPVLTFGISSTLSATDNYNLAPNNTQSAELFVSRLSFSYANRRANDFLGLDLSGLLHANEPPGGSNAFDNRRARLSYEREGVNSTLSFGAEYSLVSVDSRDPFSDNFFDDVPPDETDFTQDRGDEKQVSARFRFETGMNDPVGLILEGRYRDRSFIGTTAPDLFDTRTLNFSGTTRFTLSPLTETRLVLRYEDFDADDLPQTKRQTRSINLGLTQMLSQADTLDLSLGFQKIETDQIVGGLRNMSTNSGLIGRLGLTRELTRGTIGTSFDLRNSVNGTTATWLVSRALPLPRGALEVSLGAASDVSHKVRPVGSVNFTQEMKRGTLQASLDRQLRTSLLSNELWSTQASLQYRYGINSLSSAAFSVNFAELTQAGGPPVNDTIRADLRATYYYDLTKDWRLSTGYEYRIRDEETVGRATSNRVFLTLERNFVLRP